MSLDPKKIGFSLSELTALRNEWWTTPEQRRQERLNDAWEDLADAQTDKQTTDAVVELSELIFGEDTGLYFDVTNREKMAAQMATPPPVIYAGYGPPQRVSGASAGDLYIDQATYHTYMLTEDQVC